MPRLRNPPNIEVALQFDIQNNPRDATPKLVYADWLEDRPIVPIWDVRLILALRWAAKEDKHPDTSPGLRRATWMPCGKRHGKMLPHWYCRHWLPIELTCCDLVFRGGQPTAVLKAFLTLGRLLQEAAP